MPNANSVRFIVSGTLPSNRLELKDSMGYIEPTNKTLITEDNTKFKVYNCLFAKNKNQTIRYYDEVNGEFIDLDKYQRTFKFHIFCNKARNMLILDTNATVVKAFFRSLAKMDEDERIEVKTYNLDYGFIDQMFKTAKTIRFKSNDQGVNSKAFNGNEVTTNQEAIKAIKKDNVTSIVGVLTVRNKACTVSVSKTGSIACYSTLPDSLLKKEYPLLEFTTEVLKKLQLIS